MAAVVKHAPKAGAKLTGAEWESASTHSITGVALDTHDHAGDYEPAGTVSSHNTATDAHEDIREDIESLANAIASSRIYFHGEPSDIAGYETMETFPSTGTEDDDAVTVNAALTIGDGVLIDAYATAAGVPGVTLIPAGLWQFQMHHYMDSAVGVSTFRYVVYKREADTTETALFTVNTEEVNATSVEDVYTNYVAPNDIPIAATDRLVVKVYARTTSVANRTAHFVYEGTTNTSRIITPVDIVGATQDYYTPPIRSAAGVPVGAPSATELPFAVDTTAGTGGLYYWNGAAWIALLQADA